MEDKVVFPPTLRLEGKEILKEIKDYLQKGEEALRLRHLEGDGGFQGSEVVKGYTLLIDQFIKALFDYMITLSRQGGKGDESTIIALGGYGRGELNVRSDIDIMLLYPKRLTPYMKVLAERILYILWDTGLDVGFSIRSLKECIHLAREDLKTRTSLLDARFLVGDIGLFNRFKEDFKREVFSKKALEGFINEKLDEGRTRHARYGGSIYILEPNVKEGAGGLRDLHTALWVAKASLWVEGMDGLPDKGVLSGEEFTELLTSLDFLWRVRNELHFEGKRKMDQLTFDHQERMARLFGFENTKETLAVEGFMRAYYLHAGNISHYSNLIISRCIKLGQRSKVKGQRLGVKGIDEDFELLDGLLRVRRPDLFDIEPFKMMKAFEMAQRLNTQLDSTTRELILKGLSRVDDGFRSSSYVNNAFLNILRGRRVYETLQEMHRLRFLGRFIPEFEDITCRVQHDLYHIYTVDTHSLIAVRELEGLRGAYKKDFFILSTLLEEVERPETLVLGILLHDIGKALGKGHAEKGGEIAERICRRMGLSEEEVELVVFLVCNHLLLADTAQYRDLHDERLVIEFAKTIGDIDRLNLLYLITFTDIRAVGPEVWNDWKGALFQELYFKALTILERGTFEVEDIGKRIPRIKEGVIRLMRDEMPPKRVEEYFQMLPPRYYLSNTPDVIANHIRIVHQLNGNPYIMRVRQDMERQYTEVVICTLDMHGLFARITGVMAANNINILGAQINTLRNGVALDILQVNSPLGGVIADDRRWAQVERDLSDVLMGRLPVERLVARRRPSILDRKTKPRVPTRVEVDNEVSDTFTVIDIHTQDRVGLLYTITSTISRLGLYIYVAKITTKGDEAADIFYVKDIFGQKVYYSERVKEIKEAIISALQKGEDITNPQI